ncbi:hypothetical protein [Micromonospora sp. NPDC007220]|uniref:hypothetical protein n=1 Tax=Micromonospora sp. NPDC007220 TaxID=3154318 RepID=UPI0033EB830B
MVDDEPGAPVPPAEEKPTDENPPGAPAPQGTAPAAESEEDLRDEVHEHARYINYQYFYGVSASNSNFGMSFDGSSRRPAAATGPMRPEDVRHALRCYLRPPEAFRKARDVLNRCGMVVLCGPDGIGKYTGAIALLHEVASDQIPPTNISPALSLTELARLKFGNAGGYIVRDQLRDGEASAVQQFEVQRLTAALRGQAHLVITTNLGVRPRGPMADLMVDWAAPDPVRLFDKWLAEMPGEVCNTPAFEQLRQHVRTLICPRDVLKVVELLADGPEQALAGLRSSEQERVAAWFDREPSVDEVLGVAALTFAAGTPEPTYEFLLDRLKALYRQRNGPVPAARVETGAAAVGTVMPQSRRRDRNDSLIAVDNRKQLNLDGEAAGRSVSFAQPGMQELVLRQLHDRYGYELWAPLRDWLDEVAARPPSSLHIRLGIGMALYSTLSFQEVGHAILDRWADGTAPERLAAASTLSWIGLDGRNASAALGITKRWAQNSGQRRATTAASALGGPLGARYSSDALRWLWALAMRSVSIRMVACAALGMLFATAVEDPDTTRRVLKFLQIQLRRSLEPGSRQRDRRATFETVLNVLSARQEPTDALVAATVIRQDQRNAARLGSLWGELFCSAPHRSRTRTTLFAALQALNGDQDSLPAVRRLGEAMREVLSPQQWADLDGGLRQEADRADNGLPLTTVLTALLGCRLSTTTTWP